MAQFGVDPEAVRVAGERMSRAGVELAGESLALAWTFGRLATAAGDLGVGEAAIVAQGRWRRALLKAGEVAAAAGAGMGIAAAGYQLTERAAATAFGSRH